MQLFRFRSSVFVSALVLRPLSSARQQSSMIPSPMSAPFPQTTPPGRTQWQLPALLLRVPHRPRPNHVTCGLRGVGRRGPLWRSDVLSIEAIQVVQSLKLAKSTPRLGQVVSERLSRLLKADLLNALAELQRQNELDLALMVRNYHRFPLHQYCIWCSRVGLVLY